MRINFKMNPKPEALIKWIRTIENKIVDDLSEFFTVRAAPIIAQEIARVFVTQGYSNWSPLSPAYAKRKSITHPLKTILRRSDLYFRAATQRQHSGNIFEVTPKMLRWGVDLSIFNAPYPLFHEIGTRFMPARPVWSTLAQSNEFRTKLNITLRKYLNDKIQEEVKRVFR